MVPADRSHNFHVSWKHAGPQLSSSGFQKLVIGSGAAGAATSVLAGLCLLLGNGALWQELPVWCGSALAGALLGGCLWFAAVACVALGFRQPEFAKDQRDAPPVSWWCGVLCAFAGACAGVALVEADSGDRFRAERKVARLPADQRAVAQALAESGHRLHFSPTGLLTAVELRNVAIRVDQISPLSALKDLRRATLWNCQIRAGALAEFASLPQVTELDLTGMRLSESDLRELGRVTQLQKLNLNLTGVDDAGLAHLAGLENLEHLQLDRTWREVIALQGALRSVSDVGLQHLCGLQKLRYLSLQGQTEVTAQGLNQLHTALPRLTVLLDELD